MSTNEISETINQSKAFADKDQKESVRKQGLNKGQVGSIRRHEQIK